MSEYLQFELRLAQSLVLVPEAVLADPGQAQEDARDEGGGAKTGKLLVDMKLQLAKAGAAGLALGDIPGVVEEGRGANTSAGVVVLEPDNEVGDEAPLFVVLESLCELLEWRGGLGNRGSLLDALLVGPDLAKEVPVSASADGSSRNFSPVTAVLVGDAGAVD